MQLTAKDLQSSLEDALARHGVVGASAAIWQAGELLTAAAGAANLASGVALTPDTVMHIGSITKLFTVTLIMQLVDQGVVDLDRRISFYLPELRLGDSEALDALSVMMLLNHTSGIDGTILPDHGHDDETIEKGVARCASLGQLFRPGSEYSYCNAAMVIAGYLAQRLTGTSWYQLVKEKIFSPLAMDHAVTLPEEALLHRASVGHFRISPISNLSRRTSGAFLPLSFSPAGSTLMMSSADLVAFARAHLSHGVGATDTHILSSQSATAMRRTTVTNRGKGYTGGDDIGLAWMLANDGLVHHGGGGPGIASWLFAHPEGQWAAAILTNSHHGFSLIAEIANRWLEERRIGNPWAVARPITSMQPELETSQYIGRYEDVMTRHDVAASSGGLTVSTQLKFANYDDATTAATRPMRLLPIGTDQFLVEAGEEAAESISCLFAFRTRRLDGRMQYLGNSGRLYKRVE